MYVFSLDLRTDKLSGKRTVAGNSFHNVLRRVHCKRPETIIHRNVMYLFTEWEGRTGKYLARGHGVRTERSEVRAP